MKLVPKLEQGNDRALALRLLNRYTQEAFDMLDKWRAWFEKNRKPLFLVTFVDSNSLSHRRHERSIFPNPPLSVNRTAVK